MQIKQISQKISAELTVGRITIQAEVETTTENKFMSANGPIFLDFGKEEERPIGSINSHSGVMINVFNREDFQFLNEVAGATKEFFDQLFEQVEV